ncbi:MAG: OmpA family protein [Bauldia sp.]|nr:OmpA family protein [Bauldia sp.]
MIVALRRWFVAAIVVCAGLGALAVTLHEPTIAASLSDRVGARLGETGQTWAAATVEGRSVILTGTAPTIAGREEARIAVAGVWGVAAVDDRTELIPMVTPFTWSVSRAGGALTIAGYVPSDEVRGEVAALVSNSFPGVPVDDRTELARGAPDNFVRGVGFALRVLDNLDEGSVSLSGVSISVAGLSRDLSHYESTLSMLAGAVPGGFSVAAAAIEPPFVTPYVWQLSFDTARAEVSGYVPSASIGADVEARVRRAVGELPLDNRVTLASGAPEGFAPFIEYALGVVARLGSGYVTLTGNQLQLSGRARTPEDYAALQAAATDPVPPGLVLIASEIQPSMAEAYVLEVVRSSNGLSLIGFMPSDDARTEVIAEAVRLFGAGQIDDQLQIADGAPRMDWIGAAKFAIGQAAALSGGSARISDNSYSITGAAATSAAYEGLLAALARTLPASLVLNTSLVSAPVVSPYRFVASVGPEAVTLSGFAPSPEIRQTLATAAELRFAPLPVVVDALLADGAPAGFSEAMVAGLQAISRLEAGRLELVDGAISVSGVAPYDGAISRIEEQLRGALPPGYRVTTAITAKPAESRVTAAVCQELLTAELGTGAVKFTEGSVGLAPESEGRLDRLVAILGRCPDSRVEIGGHTDSDGTTARNRAISEQRAISVREYLVAAGVADDRLTAVGYGEANPITTNDTEEGRAQNRRIEFRILEL